MRKLSARTGTFNFFATPRNTASRNTAFKASTDQARETTDLSEEEVLEQAISRAIRPRDETSWPEPTKIQELAEHRLQQASQEKKYINRRINTLRTQVTGPVGLMDSRHPEITKTLTDSAAATLKEAVEQYRRAPHQTPLIEGNQRTPANQPQAMRCADTQPSLTQPTKERQQRFSRAIQHWNRRARPPKRLSAYEVPPGPLRP